MDTLFLNTFVVKIKPLLKILMIINEGFFMSDDN